MAACSIWAAAPEIFSRPLATRASTSPESNPTRTLSVSRSSTTACATYSPLCPADFQQAHPLERFGTVTFFEVLEHQEDPQAFLDTAKLFLNDDGFIALSVPNRNRWQIEDDPLDYPPNHLTRWSPAALRTFIESNGFEVLSLREEPLKAHRAAQILSTAFRTGLLTRVAGERPPALSDLGELPHDDVQRTVQRIQSDPRHGFATRVASWKYHALLPLAALLLPYLRLRGRTGLYLYCLARRRSSAARTARAAADFLPHPASEGF